MFLFHQLVSEPMVMRFLVNHSCFVEEISLMEFFLLFSDFSHSSNLDIFPQTVVK